MLTVDSCLCCRLETGGLVIGWLTLITSILGSISLLGFLLVLCIYNCNDMAKLFDNWTYEDLELCNGLRGVLIGVFFLLLGFIVLVGFFGFRCIQGTKARDHFRVKPLMILMAISTVLSLLQVLTFRSYAIVNGLIDGAINGYCFIVLYSLYSVFKREYESGTNRPQFQQFGKV